MVVVIVMLLSIMQLRGELWELYIKVLVAESRIRSRRQVARVREWCREDVLVKGKGSVWTVSKQPVPAHEGLKE